MGEKSLSEAPTPLSYTTGHRHDPINDMSPGPVTPPPAYEECMTGLTASDMETLPPKTDNVNQPDIAASSKHEAIRLHDQVNTPFESNEVQSDREASTSFSQILPDAVNRVKAEAEDHIDQWLFGDDSGDIEEDLIKEDDVKVNFDNTPDLGLQSPYDYMITVTIGKGNREKEFRLHSDLLTHNSAYFREMRNEAKTPGLPLMVHRQRVLTELSPDMFEMFVKYIYSRQIVLPKIPTRAQPAAQLLLGGYYLADTLSAVPFKNAVVDQLTLELKKKDIDTSKMMKWQKAFFNRIKAPKVRQLISDAFLVNHGAKYVDFDKNASGADFKHNLLLAAFSKNKPKLKDLKGSGEGHCQRYHEHDDFNPQWICTDGLGGHVKNPLKKPVSQRKKKERRIVDMFPDQCRKRAYADLHDGLEDDNDEDYDDEPAAKKGKV